jgi:hypothetical protein
MFSVYYKWALSIILIFVSLALNAQEDSTRSVLTYEMDFRFRVEQDWASMQSNGQLRADRSRMRYRYRAGLALEKSWYTFGARMRTGDRRKQQDPQLTLGKGLKEFGTLPLGLEKIYFKGQFDKLSFSIGKLDYPFTKNNELFWSDNVFPEGLALDYKITLKSDLFEPLKVHVGHFVLSSNGQSFLNDAFMQGAQFTLKTKDNRFSIFPGLFIFRNIPNIPDGAHTFLMDYSLLNLGTQISPFLDKPISFEFDYYHNVEDYNSDNNIDTRFFDAKSAYTVGLKWGTLKKADSWLFKLTYTHTERYAILDYMAQNDWGRWDYSAYNSPDGCLSNYEGVELVAAYAISDKLNLVAKYYWIEQLIPIGSTRENGQRFRLDLNVSL